MVGTNIEKTAEMTITFFNLVRFIHFFVYLFVSIIFCAIFVAKMHYTCILVKKAT